MDDIKVKGVSRGWQPVSANGPKGLAEQARPCDGSADIMLQVRQVPSNSPETHRRFMHKRSLVLLSALMIALCASPLHAGQPSGKHTVKKSKTVGKKKKSKTTKSTTTKTGPTTPDQTTI